MVFGIQITRNMLDLKFKTLESQYLKINDRPQIINIPFNTLIDIYYSYKKITLDKDNLLLQYTLI